MLELHHLLPLTSAIAIDIRGTSLVDVEPTCPNCHKSVHVYYGNYLRTNNKDDFGSKDEARDVYCKAKEAIRT
jgi:predicted HNH restriction endonuclease